MIILDCSRSIFIEEAKCNVVLCIGLAQEVFKVTPVVNVDFASPSSVCDPVKNRILLALDFMLRKKRR